MLRPKLLATPAMTVSLVASACAAAAALLALHGCSGTSAVAASSSGDDAGSDVAVVDAAPAPDGSAPPQSVTFSYHPAWDGVTGVAVVGGFGQASDWSSTGAFLDLAPDGQGGFTGTAELPPGQYLYVFRVTGDAQASAPSTYVRYAIDPGVSAHAACPSNSPTFDKAATNPCSQLTVPQAPAGSSLHVRGTVVLDGAPVAGYLVVLESDDAKASFHHFFANRVTVGQDGTFDLQAVSAPYRLQVLYPTLLSATDAERDPVSLQALRRAISTAFPLGSDVAVPDAEMGFHDYALFAPVDAGTLPTTFAFAPDGSAPTRLDVYGTGDTIGDPWFSSAPVTSGAAEFDGGFNTKQAQAPGVTPGKRYFWGTEREDVTDAGVNWTEQSMVFPITWE